MTTVELTTTSMAVGGEAIAREGSGRVVFVAGALPGETVRAELLEEKRSFARATVVEVLDAAPERVEPPCPNVALGCGGCDWQHVDEEAQQGLRIGIVADVLARAGKVVEPQVRPGEPLAAAGLRTTVRGIADADGRFAFRRRRSHDPIAVDRCLVAHAAVNDVIAQGSFPPGSEVVIRVGARTGERSVLVEPTAGGTRVPEDVTVVGGRELEGGHRAWLHEEVAGRTWRVSARSFFQASRKGRRRWSPPCRGSSTSTLPMPSAWSICAAVWASSAAPSGPVGPWWAWSAAPRRWPTPATTWPTSMPAS